MCFTGVVIGRFFFTIGYVYYSCGDRQIFCLIWAMCVTGVVTVRFFLNIGYVCYRFGDWQILFLI